MGASLCFCMPAEAQQLADAGADLSRLSIEDLAKVEITSVSKRNEPLSGAPAAIFVITSGDIRRSGARTVPEILRLAPNLQVARMGSGNYAISARGFNHQTGTANKLLVMIDGRTVYSPLFSGTFWDVQNVVIADIERIEVVSGPGGTLWGANAVNGVINIVTKSAADTQGALADARLGTDGTDFSLRYGGALGENGAWRVYGLGLRRNSLATAAGVSARDRLDNLQGGFRLDWASGADAVTAQGDIYNAGGEDVPAPTSTRNSGANLLARWSRSFGGGDALQVQSYYSYDHRRVTSGIRSDVQTFDIDAQYTLSPWDGHAIVVGAGYRDMQDEFIPGPGTSFLDPARRDLYRANVFVQDQVRLSEALELTLGLKLESNSYSGLEFMPDARIAWQVSDTALLWAAASRAVRTPSRVDSDLYSVGFAGGPDFDSENLTAYEIGYRGRPLDKLTLSVSAFYNVYTDLRTVEASSTLATFPLVVRNGMEGDTWGIEAWGTADLADWWRLSAGISVLQKDLRLKPGSLDILGTDYQGNDPDYQLSLRSSMDLAPALQFDVELRNVAELPSPIVPSYVEADVRLGWHVNEHLELSLVGQNLLQAHHPEFYNPSVGQFEPERSVYFGIRWEP